MEQHKESQEQHVHLAAPSGPVPSAVLTSQPVSGSTAANFKWTAMLVEAHDKDGGDHEALWRAMFRDGVTPKPGDELRYVCKSVTTDERGHIFAEFDWVVVPQGAA